jgi:hypothetical protein
MKALLTALGIATSSIVVGAQAAAPLPPPGEGFAYQAEGRRDPFLNLMAAGTVPRAAARAEGTAGLTTAEISVRGVVNSRGSLVAIVQGADNRTHLVRPGDKLLDGSVKAVTSEGLVILQDVNDPLSLVKQREVRRLLRSFEDRQP